jgi:hypothetical protein
VQITASRHAIKTDCGVGVAAGGSTCYDILVMVDDPANKCDDTVSTGMQVYARGIHRKLFIFKIKKYSFNPS